MSDAQLFQIASTTALVSWVALIVQPRRVAWWLRYAVPVALAVLYIWAIATSLPTAEGGFGSLAEVKLLFTNDRAVLAGWIHYLAFDLFIGCWEVLDAQQRRVHHLLVVPCLLLTFMLGPAGLLLYLVIRQVASRPAAAASET
ncbi:MAG: ABA4-like family protein [Gemmatimonas sp.]